MNRCEYYRSLAVQCVNCQRIGECGEDKRLRILGDGINCDNFIGRTVTSDSIPRCDKCEDCYRDKSKKYDGYTHYCKINGRDVGQSHFGRNSPRCCPKRTE